MVNGHCQGISSINQLTSVPPFFHSKFHPLCHLLHLSKFKDGLYNRPPTEERYRWDSSVHSERKFAVRRLGPKNQCVAKSIMMERQHYIHLYVYTVVVDSPLMDPVFVLICFVLFCCLSGLIIVHNTTSWIKQSIIAIYICIVILLPFRHHKLFQLLIFPFFIAIHHLIVEKNISWKREENLLLRCDQTSFHEILHYYTRKVYLHTVSRVLFMSYHTQN